MAHRSVLQRFSGTAVLALGLAPAASLPLLWASDRLGANPIEAITHETGAWSPQDAATEERLEPSSQALSTLPVLLELASAVHKAHQS